MRPFLKWAGNKHQIIKHIIGALPPGNRLIEPFVGSGSVFLNAEYYGYVVADINADLINLYGLVKNDGINFMDYCKSFFTTANNTEQRYYELRDIFNTTTDVELKSALFVYLNRHGFNGLCRYNSKGGFNVPFGTYDKPYFPADEMLQFHLKSQDVYFVHGDFETIMEHEPFAGDVVYCDPPYMALTDTANFSSYSVESFTYEDHVRLVSNAKRLRNAGIPVFISNHCTPEVLSLYNDADKRLLLPVQRFMAADGDARTQVTEVLAVYCNNFIFKGNYE